MLCMKFSARISFFLCLIARVTVMITTKADEDLESYYCPNTTTFSPNTTYQTNLNELLSSLSSNSHRDNGFYNTTSGVTDPAANTVYGAFLCRGDLTADECGDCVSTAAKEVLQLCPVEKDTVIWYENCMLRYADRSFFSTIEQYPTRVTVNMYNVPESERNRFRQVLRDTMKAAATEASNGGADKKFATREANFPGFQNLYTLAQCTPDLSVVDCDHCLAEAIAKLPDGRPGVRINNPSCRIRYEIFQFYNQPAVPTPEQPGPKGRQKGQDSRTIVVVVVVSVVVAGILFCFAYCFLWTKMKKSYKAVLQENFGTESTALESLQFSLATIEAATNKFSHENKIGKGGFGEVYKGILFDGRQVAIKRLSRSSGQGAVEFKNEILVIAKLQHRNLVTLLGFCLEGEEKILVYEYVPNNSLDYFLFGTQKRSVLNWSECYQIIGGIAQGILYLHKYSRLKIIHRDLKPSNILLDDNMNPKISDFGMAKIVGIDEDQGSTNRVVGTFGYMSPEYTILGQYSEKSDVFSFGVIVMEIISGKKNASRYDSQYVDGLLSYVWKQWRDEKWLEILDPNLSTEVGLQSEVIKCIQIGLLCVQENPDARPSMVTVVSYLTNDSIQLPFPQEPAFFMHGRMEPPIIGEKKSGATSNFKPCSVNEMSMSIFCPR